MAHTQVTGTKSVELGRVSYIRLKGEHKMNGGERASQTCSFKGSEAVFRASGRCIQGGETGQAGPGVWWER